MTTPSERKCAHCGTEFSGKRPNAIYCSKKCKEAARERRRYPAIDRIRQCVVCGGDFVSTSTRAVTCSKECSWTHQNHKKSSEVTKKLEKQNRQCVLCGNPIPTSRRSNAIYCSARCKRNAQSERWRDRVPGYMREYNYGLSDEDFQNLLMAQDYKCAMCKWAFGQNPRDLHVDHNHQTGQVRGLLCPNCNLLLGHANDDIARLEAAIEYLKKADSIATGYPKH